MPQEALKCNPRRREEIPIGGDGEDRKENILESEDEFADCQFCMDAMRGSNMAAKNLNNIETRIRL